MWSRTGAGAGRLWANGSCAFGWWDARGHRRDRSAARGLGSCPSPRRVCRSARRGWSQCGRVGRPALTLGVIKASFDIGRNRTMKTIYNSAVDPWIAVVLTGAPLLVVSGGVYLVEKSLPAGIIQIAAGILIGLFIASLALPCRYVIDDSRLLIQCGFLKEEIPIAKIRGVEYSSSLWSAPALSLKRVKIILDDGWRLISPRDRDEFMSSIKRIIQNEKGA